MDAKKRNFISGNLKGAIAESLVADLLRGSCLSLAKHGYKWQTRPDPKITAYNRLPDFKIENRDGSKECIEVRFRGGGFFGLWHDRKRIEYLKSLNPMPKLVLVSYLEPYFQVVPPPYDLMPNGEPMHAYPIEQETAWGISLEQLEFCAQILLKLKQALP